MSIIRLSKHESDDPTLLFRLEHLLHGVVRFVQPRRVHLVELDGWFGARWCGFAGTRDGEDIVEHGHLRCPPFAPGRVRRERAFVRRMDVAFEREPTPLHRRVPARGEVAERLDRRFDRGVVAWYSGDTVVQDRAALLVYAIDGDEQRAWYAGLRRDRGVWKVVETTGIDAQELEALESGYGGELGPLPRDDAWYPVGEAASVYDQMVDAWDDDKPSLARYLGTRLLARDPDQPAARVLLARISSDLRNFAAARELLEGLPEPTHPRARAEMTSVWAHFHMRRGDEPNAELRYRELVRLRQDHTMYWIFLGACLARQGKLDEALAIHRHATTLRGDPDEAFLNVGLVLRGMDRLDEAAEAFRAALRLDPEYEVASRALDDVLAASRARAAAERVEPNPVRPL